MRFLVDAQLPPALARHLAALGHEAGHVADVGLLSASDRDIWKHATMIGATLVTKDEDFVTLRALQASGPSVVWIRFGNTTKRAVLERFSAALPAILAALERGEHVIDVRAD